MNEVIQAAIWFLVLFAILVSSGTICVYRDIQRWNRQKARRKLGTAILNSLNL